MNKTDKILKYVALYSENGPAIWFLHENKKIYKLLSTLHLADEISNGRKQDGVVGKRYEDGYPLWRDSFILLSKIKDIWMEPNMNDKDTFILPDWDRNENEIPVYEN